MTHEDHVAWWAALDAPRRRLWGPLVAAMTPEELAQFHRERLDARAAFLWPEDGGLGDHERAGAEARAFGLWAGRLRARVGNVRVPEARELLTERIPDRRST